MSNSAACRILVISSTTSQAQQFVQRVKVLSTPDEESGSELASTDAQNVNHVPWSIVNKYYTADVHFEIRRFEDFASEHSRGVPAVVYVWAHGEPYATQIPDIARKLEGHDPEVSLAVRFGGGVSLQPTEEEEKLDELLSSHGFEFIEGDRTGSEGQESYDEDSGIPGLSRVIDALSTIMWPSLVQSESTRNRKSRARELLDWARDEEEDDGLRALISSSDNHGPESSSDGLDSDAPKKSRMQREMDELEKWLEEDDTGHKDMHDAAAWGGETGEDVMTPTIRTPAADQEGFGFEDDFVDFVGAPMDVVYEADRLVPMSTGASYLSLASDFGNGEEADIPHRGAAEGHAAEDEDEDLPSSTEIEETSRRIFGAARVRHPSDSSALPRNPPSAASTSAEPSPSTPPAVLLAPDESFGDHDDDDFELGAFDLSRVLSALQGMKEEIAGMSDETERRKAAARVALGLVYGLRKEGEGEVDEQIA